MRDRGISNGCGVTNFNTQTDTISDWPDVDHVCEAVLFAVNACSRSFCDFFRVVNVNEFHFLLLLIGIAVLRNVSNMSVLLSCCVNEMCSQETRTTWRPPNVHGRYIRETSSITTFSCSTLILDDTYTFVKSFQFG